ncbi:MAG: ABC transporter permease, partial [Longimicrobiales bacterium]
MTSHFEPPSDSVSQAKRLRKELEPGRQNLRSGWRRRAALALLSLYPPSFRREYGEEWLEVAEHTLRDARSSGIRFHAARAFSYLLAETLSTLPGVWLSREPDPSPPHRESASSMDALLQDIRFGLRTLRKRPLFALVAVGTLGLGIGAATAIFSVVEGVLLRPPPFQKPDELMSVWQTFPEWREEPMLAGGWDWIYLSYPGYERWREGQTLFHDVAIHGATIRDFSGHGDPARLWVGIASSSLLPVLGVQPILGRGFHPEEDAEGSPRVALLSHAFWVERFGEDPGVLGRTITLNQDPFTVVGVLPPEFQLPGLGLSGSPGERPIWIPVGADGYRRADNAHSYEAIGRLRPGATIQQAVPEARNLISAPDEEPEHSVRVVPWEELATEGLRSPLLLLLAASSTLLLIACGNVANLLLGESA